jgi:hypothetical protein
MLTIFTTAKPFRGLQEIIQRNALKGWTLLHPDVEVILFGNEEGAAETAEELGIRHEAFVEKDAKGNKRLNYMFKTAQQIAKHDLLCYCNCDIVLLQDFREALERVSEQREQFLMVGRRRDVEIGHSLTFQQMDWESHLRRFALQHARRRGPDWIDYFAFPRGAYGSNLPRFVVGRVFWDNWLLWKALDARRPVVDVSSMVVAVHQDHDYGYHPLGKRGVFHGEESRRNHVLAGGWRHLRTIEDATEILCPEGLRPNPKRKWSAVKRNTRQAGRILFYGVWKQAWFALLGITRPVRTAMGLRSGAWRHVHEKKV